jgi:hypothetical protein
MCTKIKILLSCLCLSFASQVLSQLNAQETVSAGRFSYNLGYSRFVVGKKSSIQGGDQKMKNITTGNLRLETNYRINNYFEAGAYIGFSNYETIIIGEDLISFTMKKYLAPSYGIKLNFQGLSYLTKNEDLRLKIYLTCKYGGQYFKMAQINRPEYGTGLGISYNIWRHLGIYGEYSVGKYYVNSNTNFRYGLIVRF